MSSWRATAAGSLPCKSISQALSYLASCGEAGGDAVTSRPPAPSPRPISSKTLHTVCKRPLMRSSCACCASSASKRRSRRSFSRPSQAPEPQTHPRSKTQEEAVDQRDLPGLSAHRNSFVETHSFKGGRKRRSHRRCESARVSLFDFLVFKALAPPLAGE